MKRQFKRNGIFIDELSHESNDRKNLELTTKTSGSVQNHHIYKANDDDPKNGANTHFFEEEDTIITTAVGRPVSIITRHVIDRLPRHAQSIIITLFNTIRDPEPEKWSNTLRQKVVKSTLGWFPVLTLTSALSVLLVAYGCASSIYTNVSEENYLWLGLLMVFVPAFIRLISAIASRSERIGLICIVGISIYLMKVILSPTQFLLHDEYLHWRTVDDIARSMHLFSENSLLPVSPLYPALEIVTNAFSSLSGVNTFTSGLVVIGISRIMIVMALFMFYEQITKSSRISGIATIIYMSNPHFFIFDALFIYESFALPIGVFMMYGLARVGSIGSDTRWLLFTTWIALAALVAAHHVTDFFFVGLLVLWTLIYKFPRLMPAPQPHLTKTAFLGILLSVVWVFFVARPVVEYLSSSANVALVGLDNVLTGANNARHLFVDYSGHPTPIWERFAMLASVGVVGLSLPFGMLCIWHRYRHNALALTLGLVALSYPLSQAFRLTSSGAEIADRSAPYIFIPIAFVLAVFISQMWPIRQLKWKQVLLLTLAASLVFVGGTVLGSGPSWVLMPGSYVVGDDARTIDPESIQAAIWTKAYIGSNKRISTDRVNRLLMSTYGDQRIVTYLQDKVDVTPVFYSTQFYPGEAAILQSAQVQYLVVDMRLSTSLPIMGFYFESGEPASFQLARPISRQALTKFNTISQINREFDSGDLVIYDVEEIVTQVPH